jgi:hypothetical protein
MAPNVELASAEEMMRQLIHKASQLFYGGGKPTVFGMNLEPHIMVEPGPGINGNLSPTASGMGVIATQGFINLPNRIARDFAIGHELGHGFGERILPEIGLQGVAGKPTEVIADLTSAYLLNQLGISWDRLMTALRSAQGQIFDVHQSGDHPPGDQRIAYIGTLMQLIAAGHSFQDASKAILMSL